MGSRKLKKTIKGYTHYNTDIEKFRLFKKNF